MRSCGKRSRAVDHGSIASDSRTRINVAPEGCIVGVPLVSHTQPCSMVSRWYGED
ncbi:hypothetical protein QJS10_CPA09g01194 [Acorus calamus]|uniref:Uncharacterized protein n=1 Tax=Acorus calamus TaxID=4465 RepID=A0AAV9E6I6_ACOCL|nr:hypothetical protein QJS10_CPA09g01194 [Acorus calamus]